MHKVTYFHPDHSGESNHETSVHTESLQVFIIALLSSGYRILTIE